MTARAVRYLLTLFLLNFLYLSALAQRGKDGSKVFAAPGTIVNEYTYLTANANAGATSISVNFSRLNSHTRFTFDLQAGDLILIIQMQGATINGTLNDTTALPNDSTWGLITNYNSAGNWELAQVRSRPNDVTINLDCGLKNSYSAAGKTQVIRVPRYTDLTILAGGEVTCEPWNGTTGGIVAIESLGDIIIAAGGKIDVSGKGFRGGRLLENNSSPGITTFGSILDNHGAEKGESIAGFYAEYDNYGGRYGKGAPANGGGGGNGQNAGGGGGANAGVLAAWNGHGNPDLSGINYANAWNLEFPGKATLTSSGGGKGGYTASSVDQDAWTVAPGNSGWGGDFRRPQGGFGGRPLDYSSGRLFMGGGGGAGDQDNGYGGRGGNGGGIIFLMSYGNISGAGQVIADGEKGADAVGSPPVNGYAGHDGAGGGGGGGAIVLNAVGTISGITASAKGGNGGNQVLTAGSGFASPIYEAQGPGGGGGGGYIAWSNGTFTTNVSGGFNGTTNSAALTEFLPNGATKGGQGIAVQNLTNFTITAQDDTICYNESATLLAGFSGNPPPGATLFWYGNQAGPPGSIGTGNSFTTPPLTTSRYYFVGSCPGTYRLPVYVLVVPPLNVDAGNDITKCETDTIQLSATGALTYSWFPPTGLTNPHVANPLCNATTTTTYVVTGNTFGCIDTDTITVNVIPAMVPEVSITVSQNNICTGTSVTFTATPVNGGPSPSYQWKINGVNVGNNAPTFTSSTLNNGDIVTVVMTTSLTGCIASSTATSNSITMVVSSPAIASVTISATQTTICPGSSVTFTATPTHGGTAPAYQWKINGVNTGPNAPIFTTNSLNQGDVVWVEMTSSAACASPATVSSNMLTVTVLPTVTPSVSISASQTTICPGGSVTFTATPTHGGTAPTYQWKINGVNTGPNAPIFTTNSLNQGDVVWVEMTSSAACASPATVSSNMLTVTVLPTVAPSVSISASQTTICPGGSVTFTATPTHGGTAPAYQWKINGVNTGPNAPIFTTNSLNQGDMVWVEMTSNAVCASPSMVISNTVTISVASVVTPSVSITASQNPICSGDSVTFTAIPINGGTSPVYQWKINGVNTGSNAATFTTTSLNQDDEVTVEMTSNASCVNPATVNSNTIIISVTTPLIPEVRIMATADTICQGETATFVATTLHGGNTPVFQWLINGNLAGGNTNIFNTTSLTNGDEVTAVMTSNAYCVHPVTVSSNVVSVTVLPVVTPTVTITASATSICMGNQVVFRANTTHGGFMPVYQWYINGNATGTNADTLLTTQLRDGDVIHCTITSNAACAIPTTVGSNSVSMIVYDTVTPRININASQTSICSGTPVTFTATYSHAGSTPAMSWYVNGINTNHSSATFTTNQLHDNDRVYCLLLSSNPCSPVTLVSSDTIIMQVVAVITPSVSINASQTVICEGTSAAFKAVPHNTGPNPSLLWFINQTSTGDSDDTYVTTELRDGDQVIIQVISSAMCAQPPVVYDTVTVSVLPSPTADAGTDISICRGDSVELIASGSGQYEWQPASLVDNPFVARPLAFPDTTTSFVLKLTAANGCSDIDTVIIFVSSCNSVFPEIIDSSVVVYPNPTSRAVHLNFQHPPAFVYWTITDLAGQQIWLHDTAIHSLKTLSIDLTTLPASPYLLRVLTPTYTVRYRIIKIE